MFARSRAGRSNSAVATVFPDVPHQVCRFHVLKEITKDNWQECIRLRVPPLRERRSEIPTIVSYYINHYSDKFGRRDIQITPQAVDLLMVGDWPGNVRQLCNEVQRIVARAEDGHRQFLLKFRISDTRKRASQPSAKNVTLPPGWQPPPAPPRAPAERQPVHPRERCAARSRD